MHPKHLVTALALAGCSDGAKQPAIDAPSADDAPMADAFDPNCFGQGAFFFCLATLPVAAVTLLEEIDTTLCDTGELVTVAGTESCVIAGTSISAATVVSLRGSRPLVFAAIDSITISAGGGLDASSSDGDLGAGAHPAACAAAATGGSNAQGGGGGAGASLGAAGGAGGSGGNGAGTGTTSTAPIADTSTLRGGCRGGDGGTGGGVAALGGDGGGALYLVARTQISIDGAVDASGGGAEGGDVPKGGGGGGGSGGMIVFHTTSLVVGATASVIANGGGGGGGGNTDNGDDGFDPISTSPTAPALGGQNDTNGCVKGGDGSAGTLSATNGSPNVNGGGGGGGGAGIVRVLAGGAPPANRVSPPPS